VTRGTRLKKHSSSRGFACGAQGTRGSWGLKTENRNIFSPLFQLATITKFYLFIYLLPNGSPDRGQTGCPTGAGQGGPDRGGQTGVGQGRPDGARWRELNGARWSAQRGPDGVADGRIIYFKKKK
jgi:hypothetical protein